MICVPRTWTYYEYILSPGPDTDFFLQQIEVMNENAITMNNFRQIDEVKKTLQQPSTDSFNRFLD